MSERPIDVLLLASRFEVRGSSTQILNIAERMRSGSPAGEGDDSVDEENELGVSARVICHNAARLSRTQREMLDVEQISALSWPVIGTLARRYLLTSAFDDPPDLIHVQGQQMHDLGRWLAQRLKRPYVMTLHRAVTPRESFRLDRVWGQQIVATSETIRRSVLEHTRTPPSRVTVIRNGVKLPSLKAKEAILDLGHRPVIGTAGPLETGQGLGHFLRAIPRILASGPAPLASSDAGQDGPEFLIAGTGPDERALRGLARELGIQTKTTFVSNLYDFSESLSAMDIFCLPVERTGMGVTMLEAMARGVPVIATDLGHVSNVIDDGVTGMLIPPGSPDAISNAVTSLLRDVPAARRIGSAGRAVVRERYPLSHMLEDMRRVYQSAVEV